MQTGSSIVGDNIKLWAEINLAPAFSSGGRFMYTSIEWRDVRNGTMDWKQIKTKPIPAKLIKIAPLYMAKKHGDLKAFLKIPKEIRLDFELINIKQAKEIQGLVREYQRATRNQ